MKANVGDNIATYIASEKSLAKDWLTPEEDLAWQDLDEMASDAGRLALTQAPFAEECKY